MNPINHSQMLIHVIFSTKNQKPLISTEIEPLLYDKISKILYDECYSPALIIGGGVEHLHILFAQSRDWSVDAIVNRVKTRSAEFMKRKIADFAWQKGYGAFPSAVWTMSLKKNTLPSKRNFTKKFLTKTNFVGFWKGTKLNMTKTKFGTNFMKFDLSFPTSDDTKT